MDIEGENEVYQEGYFSPYYMDEPPTKKVSFSGTLETSMRELVQDFYQWLGEIDDEIAQHLEQVSEDKNIPASEVAVLAISQSDRLMTANDYLVASSPDIYSMYEDIADYGFNYDVNLDNSLLQSKMPEIEKIIQEHGGVSNRTQDELEDRFEPQVLVRDGGEAIVTPLVYDNQENKYITVSSVADTLKEMLIPDVHGEITAENGESIPFNAHMDVESESKLCIAFKFICKFVQRQIGVVLVIIYNRSDFGRIVCYKNLRFKSSIDFLHAFFREQIMLFCQLVNPFLIITVITSVSHIDILGNIIVQIFIVVITDSSHVIIKIHQATSIFIGALL